MLRSISRPEYAAFGHDTEINTDKHHLNKPWQLMAAGFPMVPFDALDTFTSVKEAAVWLTYSAFCSYIEEKLSLELWAEAPHKTALFRLGHYDLPIIAVRFDKDHVRLGSSTEEKQLRLPRELHVEASTDPFTYPDDSDSNGFRAADRSLVRGRLSDISSIPTFDAFFEVLNDDGFNFLKGPPHRYELTDVGKQSRNLKWLYFKPHFKSFTFDSLMGTSRWLQSSGERWHDILLNQDIRSLEVKDMTEELLANHVREADNWMSSWKPWNPEQREVLSAVHATKGGMVIVKGIAGTGKTLLQSVLSIYFARLGFKVLVSPPSNSNANHTAVELAIASQHEHAPPRIVGPTSPIWKGKNVTPISESPSLCRVFASSLGNGIERTSKGQAQYAQPFHEDGATSTLVSLMHTPSKPR